MNTPKPSLYNAAAAANDRMESSDRDRLTTGTFRYQYKPAFRAALYEDRTSFRAWNSNYQPKKVLGSDIKTPVVASFQATKDAVRSQSLDSIQSTRKTDKSTLVRGDRMIPVLPGVELPLCGATETWQAMESGWYTQCTCPCCNLAMLCVDTAEFVVCPECRVVSPVQGCCDVVETTSKRVESSRIVGLGLRHDMLPHNHFHGNI
jgi:hypothetical protein